VKEEQIFKVVLISLNSIALRYLVGEKEKAKIGPSCLDFEAI
jgi:hypothetical protein